jgi:hypothetical protein
VSTGESIDNYDAKIAALAGIFYEILRGPWQRDASDPDNIYEPLVHGCPVAGERTLIDGVFDLREVARRILERGYDLISD